jgi:O-antigen/teichoic acid export membrane protein
VLVVAAYLGRDVIERVFPYDDLGVILAAAVALSLFEIFFTIISRILQANYDTRRLSLATITGQLIYLAALVFVLARGWGVLGVVLAAAGGNVVACLMLLSRARAALVSGNGGTPIESDEADSRITGRRLARFSVPFAAIGVLNWLVWRQSETMFLAHFRTAAETGFFDLAYRLPQTMLEFVPAAVWPLVMAGFSEIYTRNVDDLRRAIDRYYRMLFLLCTPICVVGIVLGGRMIPILFGEAMSPAAIPTQVFFGVFTISFFGTPLSMSLYVLEKTYVNLIVYLCLAVVNVGLDLLLIPRFGVAGAVVPVALVTAASPFIYRVLIGRYVDNVRIPVGFIGKCFLASGVVLVLVPVLRYITGPIQLAIAFAVAGVLIVLAFKMVRVLGKKELDMLGAVPIPMANRLLKFIAS